MSGLPLDPGAEAFRADAAAGELHPATLLVPPTMPEGPALTAHEWATGQRVHGRWSWLDGRYVLQVLVYGKYRFAPAYARRPREVRPAEIERVRQYMATNTRGAIQIQHVEVDLTFDDRESGR